MCKLKRLDRKELGVLGGLIAVTVLGLVIALLVKDDGAVLDRLTGEPEPTPLTLEEIPLATRAAKVAGTLPRQARVTAVDEIDEVLTRYVADAFLGQYPRPVSEAILTGFTSDLQDSAGSDLDLLSGLRWSESDAFVEPWNLDARLTLLASKDRAVGATAHFRFVFDDVLDEQDQGRTVRGRFLLTRVDGEWVIFGYDVAGGDSPIIRPTSDEGADQ